MTYSVVKLINVGRTGWDAAVIEDRYCSQISAWADCKQNPTPSHLYIHHAVRCSSQTDVEIRKGSGQIKWWLAGEASAPLADPVLLNVASIRKPAVAMESFTISLRLSTEISGYYLEICHLYYIFLSVRDSEIVRPFDNLTNSMEHSPWDASSHTASQETPRLQWNPKFHYRVHKGPTLVPILSQIHQIHSLPRYLSKIQTNIIIPSTPDSSKWSPPASYFPTTILNIFSWFDTNWCFPG
jgi:hypothetical protein